MIALHITGDDAADELLSSDPFALLVGMLLDQQVAMETAFAGPEKIRERLGRIDPGKRCTAGDCFMTAANSSGSYPAMVFASNRPSLALSLAGPANAVSMGTCWSSSMPTSSASGSVVSRASASASPVMCSSLAMSPWCTRMAG